MNPYNTDYDRNGSYDDNREPNAYINRAHKLPKVSRYAQTFANEQLAKTWFHRIKEDAIRIEMLNDLPF